jgi:hypothetical protein
VCVGFSVFCTTIGTSTSNSSSSSQKMKNWASYSPGNPPGSGFPLEPSVNTTNDEVDVLLSSMTKASSLSLSSKKSKSSESSKQSRMSMTNKDERDDYSGRISNAATNLREKNDVLVSLPASMATSPSVYSKLSVAASRISQSKSEATPIPRDLIIESRNSNSSQSRKSMSSRSRSKGTSTSAPASIKPHDDLGCLSAVSARAEIAVLKEDGLEAKSQTPSVTASMASKRRQLKAKEIEMEEKTRAFEQAEQRNMQREKEINEKIAALWGEDKDEAMAMQQRLKELEKELNERKRVLKRQEEDREREINNKLEAIRMGEKETILKEKQIEQMSRYYAQKKLEIFERLAAMDEASVTRRKKDKELEAKVIVFAQKEKEIKDRLAAIDEASAARRKLEASTILPKERKKKNNKGGLKSKLRSIFRRNK